MSANLIATIALDDEDKSYVTTKIPPGGKAGYALVKASNKNYDVKWSGSGVGSGGACGCDRITIADILKIINS